MTSLSSWTIRSIEQTEAVCIYTMEVVTANQILRFCMDIKIGAEVLPCRYSSSNSMNCFLLVLGFL